MKKNNFKFLVIMELKIMLKNILFLIFGLALPLFLVLVVGKYAMKDVPEQYMSMAHTSLFLGFAVVIPFSAMYIGYASLYSDSLEKEIPLRLELFGNSPQKLFLAKLVANLIYISVDLILFCIVSISLMEVEKPSIKGALVSIVLFYILSALFLLLAHGIAYAFRKFGSTYAVTMSFYFFTMVTSGLMGIPTESLPKFIGKIGKLTLPTYHIASEEYLKFFIGEKANLAPLVQSTVTFGAIVLLVFIGAHKFRKRIGQYKKI
ncbi:MAG: hypothetical protein Q4E02_01025 [Lagierella massiliensis]|nr:hypothetical protein [Lagierella massiliensis]